MATVTEKLLTAEELTSMPDPGHPTELVRGKVIEMAIPGFQHGLICSTVARLVSDSVEQNAPGRVVSSNSGVITERNPDTVRGPDVAYYSYERLPQGSLPEGYPSVAPELIFEVLTPGDRTHASLKKVAEYLTVGVKLVCVFDPRNNTIQLHRSDEPLQILKENDTFTVPDILPGFSVPVRQIFE